MHENLNQLAFHITNTTPPAGAELPSLLAMARQVPDLSPSDVRSFLQLIAQSPPPSPGSPQEKLLAATLGPMAEGFLLESSKQVVELSKDFRQQLSETYDHLGGDSVARHHLLRILVAARGAKELELVANRIATDPPLDSDGIQLALAPLFQNRDWPITAIFPAMLPAIGNTATAPVVLDLCNFLTRESMVDSHPARDHATALLQLLESFIDRLETLTKNPPFDDLAKLKKSQQQVQQSVPLVCSLCDALALMQCEESIATLSRAAELPHRRIRTEAAAALARLGSDEGRQALLDMAAYPVSRLRALHYAEELGFANEVDEKWQTPQAEAEAMLACWLAEPLNFGAPPAEMELIDETTQFWPSYDEPQACYLFRFTYPIPQGEAAPGAYTNVGIAGPLTHAFMVDISGLSKEEMYAMFAGWQAEHPEIQEIAADQFDAEHHDLVASLTMRLADSGFIDVQPVKLVLFFGQWQLVAVARRAEHDALGVVIAGSEKADWFSQVTDTPRPPGPHEIFNLWKGRWLLKAFNE